MKQKSILLGLSIVLLLLMSCSRDETYNIEIKDGVRHVHNRAPMWKDEPKVALEFVQKIGVLEGKDENYLLFKPSDVSRDYDGNIYVLDSGNYRIQKFDANGKYLATIGRKGQGPGELLSSKGMCIGPDNIIYVPDSENRRVQKFSLDGKEEGSFRMTERRYSRIRCLSSGNLVPYLLRLPTSGQPDITATLLAVTDKQSEILHRFGEILDLGDIFVNTMANIIYFDVDSDDNIYLTFKNENMIDKYASDGTHVSRADRPLNYKVENSWKWHTYESPGRGTFEAPLQDLTDVALGLGIDWKDRIWVYRFKKQPKGPPPTDKEIDPNDWFVIEIFNNDGVLLGKLPVPEIFSSISVCDDRLYFIDPNKEICIYEYRIIEK